MAKFLLSLIVFVSITITTYAEVTKKSFRSVAIVADREVYAGNLEALRRYANSIEADGLRAIIVEDIWGIPDSIRAYLQKLYSTEQLEGVVFVGDIPIPMIRNGQHLTTAFKMNQDRDWTRSSVPSDRFYDDFDLQFDFIKQDSTNELYYYYNLSPHGTQTVHSNIYSARIKPPVIPGKSKSEQINDYFDKVVAAKQAARKIENVTFFAGHGYNSDCMIARMDERMALASQFNGIGDGSGFLNYIDHSFDTNVRDRLLAELEREGLDLAILHHHGSDDLQLLNGTPQANMASKWIEMTQKFFRGKIRAASDTVATKQYYLDNYSVPESWVENAFDPIYMQRDSLEDAALDLHLSDVKGHATTPPLIVLDACFNGSFHLDDYISGHYVFNPGNTVVVKANSVNTLQDIWTNQLIGLLDLGVSVGNWAREQFTLESHLIGDPTYRYVSSRTDFSDLNDHIVSSRHEHNLWRHLFMDDNPEVKALAMKVLFENTLMDISELYSIQTSHTDPTVRLMAFELINKRYNPMVTSSIRAGLYDNYELIRRFAARNAQTHQHPDLLNDIVAVTVSPTTSKRVLFQSSRAMNLYPAARTLAAYDSALAGKTGAWYEGKTRARESIERTLSNTERDFSNLLDPEVPVRSKRFVISALRNSNQVAYLDTLFQFMQESGDVTLREALAEAFGWYTNSWMKDEILAFCRDRLAAESDENVRAELTRTINRLSKT